MLQAKADGVVEIQYVGEPDVAVTGGIQFADMLNAITLLELRPHAGTQAITDHLGHAVIEILSAGGLIEQVAAQLADIAQGGCVEFARIVPELASAEFTPDGKARSPDNRR